MRRFEIPEPGPLTHLAVDGPIGTRAVARRDRAERVLEEALRAGLAAEADGAPAGWAVVWTEPWLASFGMLKLGLWCDDDGGGDRIAGVLAAALEGAGFMVRRRPRPTVPGEGREVLYARAGGAATGRFHRLPVERVVAPVDVPRVEHRWRWPVQPCPHCGHRGHPLDRIAGFPSDEGRLAVALGEAVYAGCEPDDTPAECAACGRGFAPRG